MSPMTLLCNDSTVQFMAIVGWYNMEVIWIYELLMPDEKITTPMLLLFSSPFFFVCGLMVVVW